MHKVIRVVSFIIILLGIVHISFAFPLQWNTGTLWFVGAGFSIIYAGMLNLIAIDRAGSRFTKVTALIVNGINCAMFCIALRILNEPQVYVGILIFLITTLAFFLDITRNIRNA